jgi:hypothetical protein
MSDELLASDAEREQAVARLRDASAEGRLTLDELVERASTAYAARTHGELERATAGLPAPTARGPVRDGKTRVVLALFAPVRRSHRWQLGRRTFVISLFAPTSFELGGATVETDEAEIVVFSVFAPVSVTAPREVDVETDVTTVFGPVIERGEGEAPVPGGPRIRITGLSLFAPVFVKHGS